MKPSQQLTLMVPKELHALIRDHELSTGAAITRIINAAILQYFLSAPEGPDPVWIKRTVMLKQGDITHEDIRKELTG